MNLSNEKGLVYYRDIFAGTLYIDIDGEYVFSYDDKYLNSDNPPISLTMPKVKKEYRSNILFPFFDGLIMEGWLLDVAIRKYEIKATDRYSILLLTAKDPLGAVSIIRSGK